MNGSVNPLNSDGECCVDLPDAMGEG